MAVLEKSEFGPDKVTLRLTRDEYDWLLLVMGYALGAATKEKDQMPDSTLADKFVCLANRINRDNPDWCPYGEPGEAKRQRGGAEGTAASPAFTPPGRAG